MGSPTDGEYLLQTMRICVDEVFDKMVTGFRGAAVTAVHPIQSRENGVIKYSDKKSGSCSDELYEEAVIPFTGDVCGQVVLRCSGSGAKSIARGLLMMDESEALGLSDVRDALGECANMLAGALKSKALDPNGSFRLGLPEFGSPGPAGASGGALVYRVAEDSMSVEVWCCDTRRQP